MNKILKSLGILTILILLLTPITTAEFSPIAATTDITGKVVRPGDTVENKYDSRATVKLSVLSKPNEWGVDLLSTDGARITKLSIPAKGKQDFEVVAQPPTNATDGDYEVLIGASMESGSQIISLPLSISINPDIDSTQALSAYILKCIRA